MTDEELAQTGDYSAAAMARRARAVRYAFGNLTQKKLAERLCLSESAVKTWESPAASTGIRPQHIAALSKITGIRTDFIINGDVSDIVIPPSFWSNVRDWLRENPPA